jgi:hypothetical protein
MNHVFPRASQTTLTSFTSFDELYTGYWRRFARRTQELCATRRRIQNGGGLELSLWMHRIPLRHIWLSFRPV